MGSRSSSITVLLLVRLVGCWFFSPLNILNTNSIKVHKILHFTLRPLLSFRLLACLSALRSCSLASHSTNRDLMSTSNDETMRIFAKRVPELEPRTGSRLYVVASKYLHVCIVSHSHLFQCRSFISSSFYRRLANDVVIYEWVEVHVKALKPNHVLMCGIWVWCRFMAHII